MPTRFSPTLAAILVATLGLAGCATQPTVAQNTKKQAYVEEKEATTGSHLKRRYAVDEVPTADASNVESVNASQIQQTQFNPRKGN